jgi:hypothetical protein
MNSFAFFATFCGYSDDPLIRFPSRRLLMSSFAVVLELVPTALPFLLVLARC